MQKEAGRVIRTLIMTSQHEQDAEAIKNVWGRDGITVPSQMDKGVGKPGTKSISASALWRAVWLHLSTQTRAHL